MKKPEEMTQEELKKEIKMLKNKNDKESVGRVELLRKELNLRYIFEKLFAQTGGGGYPPERAVPERNNKLILDQVKTVTHRNMGDILRELDRDLVKGALAGEEFSKHFFNSCYDKDIAEAVKEILA